MMIGERQFTINDLPDEMLASIFVQLTLADRVQCKLACRRWRWIIEKLICVHSLLITSDRRRSIVQSRLCEAHRFTGSGSLIVNPIENLALIFQANLLTSVRSLKIDFDTDRELHTLRWPRILRLLELCSLLEHLELRAFVKQTFEYLTIVNDQLIAYNRRLKHLSLKKIQFMDFLYIRDLDPFEQLFTELVDLSVFECDFCILNNNGNNLYATRRPSKRKVQLSKLYLPNANSVSIDLMDDFHNLRSLGLGSIDERLLNQLLDCTKYRYLNRLEIKIRGELNGEFITNRTVKQLTIHSLGIREKANNVLQACRAIEQLTLINCLFANDSVEILINNHANCLTSLSIENDYWDDDRQVDHLITRCFAKCSKLTTGHFKNIKLVQFYTFIYTLAIRNPTTIYTLYLDYMPNNDEFDSRLDNSRTDCLPVNLILSNLYKDYNY